MGVQPLDVSVRPLTPTFHPHLTLDFGAQPGQERDSSESCRIHLSLTLPDSLFVDPDELAGSWASGLSGVVSYDLDPCVIDIERPYRAAKSEQTPIRLDVVLSDDVTSLDVPLHGRYLPPDQTGYKQITVINGQGSEEDDSGTLRAARLCSVGGAARLSPTELPIVALQTPVTLVLPTGKHSHQRFTEIGTAAVIWLGWVYLVWKIWRLVQRVDKKSPSGSKKTD